AGVSITYPQNQTGQMRNLGLIVRTNRSVYAFRFGDRGGSFTDSIPCSANMVRNSRVYSGSRSWIQIPFSFEESIDFIGYIASNLHHPKTICLAYDSADLYTSR